MQVDPKKLLPLKAILWGKALEHLCSSQRGSLSERTAHLLLGIVELIPVIGQLVAAIDFCFFEGKKIKAVEQKPTPTQNVLLSFWQNKAKHPRLGLTIEEMSERSKFSQESFENEHDFIQWLFPTKSRSQYNQNAPILDELLIEEIKKEKTTIEKVFSRTMNFYGFNYTSGVLTHENKDQTKNKLSKGNHNLLRVTRILDSLCLLGEKEKALLFFNAITDFMESDPVFKRNVQKSYDNHFKPTLENHSVILT